MKQMVQLQFKECSNQVAQMGEGLQIFLIITRIMPQRKKNQNKENFRVPKKPNIQLLNHTQQVRMPTLATMDLRQAGRSIELVKSIHKKPASRKTRCVSVKPSVCPNIKFKQMMRQIKSMKLMQSKDKSPSSNKLRSKSGKSSQKITQLNTVQNSQMNLTAKLQKTLKKLNQTDYFKDDDDSLIPLVSSSDAFTYAEKQNLLLTITENYEDINIREMRAFCRNSSSVYKKNVQFFKGNNYENMARKIQRAWRRYRTHKLVNRYVSLPINYTPSMSSELGNDQTPQNTQKSKISQQKDIVIQSDELYPQQEDQRKITYISNLDPDEQNGQGEQQRLRAIKQEQLKKWSQVIDLIIRNKSDNPADKQRLLKKLMNESKINIKNLLSKEVEEQQEGSEEYRDSEGEEQESQKHQEFNSKKYIEYLDSDMYPIEPNLMPTNTINKNKQQELLRKLSQPKYKSPKKFEINQNDFLQDQGKLLELQLRQLNRELNDESKLSYRSLQSISEESIQLGETMYMQRQIERQNNNRGDIRERAAKINKNIKNILKCNSEKFMKKYYEKNQLSNSKQKQLNSNEVSLDPLTQTLQKQFQEEIGEDAQIQRKSIHLGMIDNQERGNEQRNFDKLYTEEQLSKKLAELKRLKEQDSDDEYGQIFSSQKQKEQEHQNKDGQEPILHRSSQKPLQDLNNINIEDYDRNIESQSDEGDLAEKSQNIANMVFNSLIFDILKEMTKYSQTILKKFKEFSIKKPKIKRAHPKPKKNGFQTNQTEVKNFINELCGYLLHDEPHIFKNLQKATGPSAIEMLRYMHQASDEQIYLEDEDDDPSIMVMPNWVFDNYWLKKVSSLKYQKHGIDEQRELQRQQYLKSLNKIFYRSLFDCLNECLDFERNFGPFGRPFPWKRAPVFNHVMTAQETKESVEKSQKKLLEITSTYCGIIIEKQEMVSICGNQEYLQQVQEDRLSRMLAQDLVQGQQRWIFYDDEETQLLVETSNIIFNLIMMQTIQVMEQISLKDKQGF